MYVGNLQLYLWETASFCPRTCLTNDAADGGGFDGGNIGHQIGI